MNTASPRRTLTQLGRALLALTPGHGELLRETSRAWRSVTFSGQRCTFELRYAGIDAAIMGEALLEELAETEIHALGKVAVADLAIKWTERQSNPLALTVALEIITLDMPEKP